MTAQEPGIVAISRMRVLVALRNNNHNVLVSYAETWITSLYNG